MSLLETVQSPADIRSMKVAELEILAEEIRTTLVQTISELGGHLASSLGAVELCLALHYVFDTPRDAVVWDMGYQAFTTKLITGRRDRFHTLKQYKGLSGFNHKDESPYDLFITGHGGTCISTAMGLALSRDLSKRQRKVVAVLGDASLGEGMALEALNHLGHLKSNMIVILNDNEMSISKPVGGLSKYLTRVLSNPAYNRMREEMGDILVKLPKGERLVDAAHRVEDSLKGLVVPGRVFQDLGLRYVGPAQGHNIGELIHTLKNVKQLKGPTLLHVATLKGKGYKPAEEDPERFHKTEPFYIETGLPKLKKQNVVPPLDFVGDAETYARWTQSFSAAFSEELVAIGKADRRLVAINAAMPEGTGVDAFGRAFPERCIDVGMAEQHAVGLAAGLCADGKKPVVAIYSTFMQRAFDQIMHEVSLQRLPVILALDRASLVGEDGATHHGVFDVSYLRMLPNICVASPKDAEELRAMLRWAVAADVPVALRYPRGGIVCGEPLGLPAPIEEGKSEVLKQGKSLTLLALGSMVYPALEAAKRLDALGFDVGVVNARFAKPLDRALLDALAKKVGCFVTLEEGQIAGGFGSAVSEALDALGHASIALHRIGIEDAYVEHGRRDQLLKHVGLDVDSLVERIGEWHKKQQVTTELMLDSGRIGAS